MAEVRANTAKHWFTKWGLWILLGIAVVIGIIAWLIPASKDKDATLRKAKDEAKRLKDEVSQELEKHNKEMANRKAELMKVKAMEDEEARLKALADFANRRDSG